MSIALYSFASVSITNPAANGTNQTSAYVLFNVSSDSLINASLTVLEWTNESGQVSNVTPTQVVNATINSACASNNCNYSFWNITVLQGVHTLKAYVWENTTNPVNTSASRTITVDSTAPTASLNHGNFNTSDSTPEISFNLTDNVSTQDLWYKVYIGNANDTEIGIANVTNGTLVKYNLSARGNGSVIVRIEARDALSNIANSSSFIINVSTQAPSAVFNTSFNNLNITNTTLTQINFTINRSALFTQDLAYKLFMDGVNATEPGNANTTLNAMVQVNFTNLTGAHVFNAEIRDPAGNAANSSQVTLYLNATPEIIFSTANFTNSSDTTPTITFNVTNRAVPGNGTGYKIYFDPGSGFQNYTELNNVTNGTEISFTAPALANGTFQLKLETRDIFGNIANTTNFTIRVDDTRPTVVINSPSGSTSTTDTTPAFDFTITDNFFTNDLRFKIYDGNTINTQGGDAANATSYSTSLAALSTGAHTVKVEASDPAGNAINSTSRTITITTSSSSSSSSSSGGGGSAVTSEALVFPSVQAGIPLVKSVSDTSLVIKEVSLQTFSPATNVRITVTKHGSRPPSVDVVDGVAYAFMDINATSLTTSNIDTALVRFTVTKSWMTTYDFTTSDITLQHYTGSWDSLSTLLVSQDSTNAIFEAATPSFSTFAVIGKSADVVENTTETTEENTTEEPAAEPPAGDSANTTTTPGAQGSSENQSAGQQTSPASGLDSILFVAGVLIVAVVGAGAYLYRKSKMDRLLSIRKKK